MINLKKRLKVAQLTISLLNLMHIHAEPSVAETSGYVLDK